MTSEGDRSTDVPTHTANLPAQSPDGRRVLADAPGVAGFAPGTIVGERFRISAWSAGAGWARSIAPTISRSVSPSR